MNPARDLVRDLGHAARRLLVVVVTTLAVSVGSSAASVVRGLLRDALSAAAGLAAWPARRAALIDPAAVMRQE